MHLVSDATGETLITAARAVSSQYTNSTPIEHVYPLVRRRSQLDVVIKSIDKEPGIVLYTIVDNKIAKHLEMRCAAMGIPHVSLLKPVQEVFQSYLGTPSQQKVGAQHVLDIEYFSRIEALDYTMAHDDGVLPADIEEAEIILVGISRTSKTPTAIYLANRGVKTANYPLVPNIPLPAAILNAKKPLIVALIATADQIYHVRQNRELGEKSVLGDDSYTNRASIAEELSHTRKLCKQNNWPMIDVTRRSIEEASAEILELRSKHLQKLDRQSEHNQPTES
ncbi:MAG: kinase/pyrophosphorylase [Rhizobiaceae bacterium]|nr:kinase/pyrophosphorylase [Rhizobiaceae bacterium]